MVRLRRQVSDPKERARYRYPYGRWQPRTTDAARRGLPRPVVTHKGHSCGHSQAALLNVRSDNCAKLRPSSLSYKWVAIASQIE